MAATTTKRRSDAVWGGVQRMGAGLALVAASPVLAGIAVAIRLESGGPVLFKQPRPGFRGDHFTALKFRSMYTGSEGATKLGVSAGDARITRVGRFIRATKLDELPQLWNIVKGDMRFVGPRPIPVALDEALHESIPGFSARYAVRPGLTSLAQVCVADNGLNDRLVDDWRQRFEAERRYIANRCVVYDVVILVLTALFVFRKATQR